MDLLFHALAGNEAMTEVNAPYGGVRSAGRPSRRITLTEAP